MDSYSLDLRERVIQAWQDGHRQGWIAETFGVSVSTLKAWIKRFRETGSLEPLARGREQPLIADEQAKAVQAMVDSLPEATLDMYCATWEQRTGESTDDVSRFAAFRPSAKKKTIAARERDEALRQEWREVAETLPARRVIVFDESGTHLAMTPRYARAARGERAHALARRNTGKNMTLLAGITLEGMIAPFVVEGAVTTAVMETYLEQVLLPTLRAGDIVILDNLSVHHAASVTHLLTQHACRVLFLPAYSPDFSPIEHAFAKIKTTLRRLRAQTLDALLDAIALALDAITPGDAIGYFTNAGFLNLN